MTLVAHILAAVFILYAAATVFERPGFFASVLINSYIYSVYFGSLGPISGLWALTACFAVLASAPNRLRINPIAGSEWILLIWFALSLSSIFASDNLLVSIDYWASLILLAFGAYMMGRTFSHFPTFTEDLIAGCFICAILCAPQLAHELTKVGSTVSGVGVSLVADLPIAATLTCAFFLPSEMKKYTVWMIVLTLFVMLPITIAFGKRGVFVAIAFECITLAILSVWHRGPKAILQIGAAIMASVAVIGTLIAGLFLLTGLGQSKIGKVIVAGGFRIVSNFGTGGTLLLDRSGAERLALYQQAERLIADAPILGHGIGAFGYMANNAFGAYPHNMVLEILVNNGVLGLILFGGAIIVMTKKAMKAAIQKPADWRAIFVLCLLAGSLVRLQLSMSLTMGKAFFLALGVVMSYSEKKTATIALEAT